MKPSRKESARSKAVVKGTVTVAKHVGVSRSAHTTRRRTLHDKSSRRRMRDALKRAKQDLEAIESVSVDQAFEASMMAKLQQAAAKDPPIAALIAAAKEDPEALLVATEIDPTITKSLAEFFVQEIANDPTTAIEIARIASITSGPAAAQSSGINTPIPVTSDSDNNELSSSDSLSSDEESLG